MTELDNSIKNCLCYASIFDCPISIDQLLHRINLKTKSSILSQRLNYLHNLGKIVIKHHWVTLKQETNLITKRQAKIKITASKFSFIQRRLHQLVWIPWIQEVYLTGSLAADNPNLNDDIDLLIITSPHRLWISRLILNLYLDMVKLRRKRLHTQVDNLFCLNMWLTSNSLVVPPTNQNLYTAYEVMLAKQIYRRPSYWGANFKTSNDWIINFFPNYCPPKYEVKLIHNQPSLTTKTLDLINHLAYLIQFVIMKRSITRETIGPELALFHPRDAAKNIINLYQNKINQVDKWWQS